MGLNTSAVGNGQGTTEFYGHADYNRDKAAGMSDYDILQQINADTSKMGNGGTGGELYQQIVANAKPPSSNNNSGGNYGGGNNTGGGTFKKAYGKEFQENLNEATEAYRPEDKGNAMTNPEYAGTGTDFRKQVQREKIMRDEDPFGDSWNSIDFFGKHLTMAREAQKGRGDASSIANKYIFNAAQTNPVDIQALDKQIRTAPLYSEAKSELAKVKAFGDTYANSNPSWNQPTPPSAYEGPDLQGMYDKQKKDIEGISL